MFQSTPSGGKATWDGSAPVPGHQFQSTPSGGKATRAVSCAPRRGRVSIHAFRGEGDRTGLVGFGGASTVSIHAFRGEGDGDGDAWGRGRDGFNPRLPGGRRRPNRRDAAAGAAFQSTPSGGKATRTRRDLSSPNFVSIHAFRGEGDTSIGASGTVTATFQSTPSGGKATSAPYRTYSVRPFQSTPSGGKATGAVRDRRGDAFRFNPRLPGGRRRVDFRNRRCI